MEETRAVSAHHCTALTFPPLSRSGDCLSVRAAQRSAIQLCSAAHCSAVQECSAVQCRTDNDVPSDVTLGWP